MSDKAGRQLVFGLIALCWVVGIAAFLVFAAH